MVPKIRIRRPGSAKKRNPITLLACAVFVLIGGIGLVRGRSLDATDRLQRVELEDLEAGLVELGDGLIRISPHVSVYPLAVYEYESINPFVTDFGDVSVNYVLTPVVSRSFHEQTPEYELPGNFKLMVIERCFDTVSEIPDDPRDTGSVEGMVVEGESYLDWQAVSLLRDLVPDFDPKNVRILDPEKRPESSAVGTVLFLLSVTSLLLGLLTGVLFALPDLPGELAHLTGIARRGRSERPSSTLSPEDAAPPAEMPPAGRHPGPGFDLPPTSTRRAPSPGRDGPPSDRPRPAPPPLRPAPPSPRRGTAPTAMPDRIPTTRPPPLPPGLPRSRPAPRPGPPPRDRGSRPPWRPGTR